MRVYFIVGLGAVALAALIWAVMCMVGDPLPPSEGVDRSAADPVEVPIGLRGTAGTKQRAVDSPSDSPDVAAPSDGGPSVVLRGTVVDRTGKPVSGAVIAVHVAHPRYVDGHSTRTPIGGARSQDDGAWELGVSWGRETPVYVFAKKDGSSSRLHVVKRDILESRETITLVLRPGLSLRVRVRDEAGNPAPAGLAVVLTRGQVGAVLATDSTKTDSSGECQFEGVSGDVLVHVDGGGGLVHGRPFSVKPNRENVLDLKFSAHTKSLLVKLRASGPRGPYSQRVWAQIVLGRHSSGFWLQPGGPGVARRHDARLSDRVVLTLDLPDGTRLKHEWSRLDEAVQDGVLDVRLGSLVPVRVRLSVAGDQPWPSAMVLARARDSVATVYLESLPDGTVTCTMPAGRYGLSTQHGYRLGDIVASPNNDTEQVVQVPGFSVIKGSYSPWSEGLRGVRLEVNSGTVERTDLPSDALSGGSRHRRMQASPYTHAAFVKSGAWAVVVPWPAGVKLTVTPLAGGRLSLPSVRVTAGGNGVTIIAPVALARVSLRPTHDGVAYLAGVLTLRRLPGSEDAFDGGARGRAHPWTAKLGQDGVATFYGVLPGRYVAEYSGPLAQETTWESDPISVATSSVDLSCELK